MLNTSNLNNSNINYEKKYYFVKKISGHLLIMNQNCDFFFLITYIMGILLL